MNSNQYEHFYNKEKFCNNLRKRSISGGVNAFAGQAGMFIIQLLSTAALARLLTPDQFGLVAMVMVISAFAQIFKDLGLSAALIQRDKVTHDQVSTIFWINTVVAVGLAFTVGISGHMIAGFYGDERLVAITYWMSTSFVFSGLIVVPQALLRRQLMMGRVAVVRIVSRLLSCGIGVVLAWTLKNYWALVAMHVTFSMFEMILFFLVTRWFPMLPRRHCGVGDFYKFGSGIAGFNIVNYFSRNLDKLLIGRFIGSEGLGNYSKAYQLLMLPITQIRTPVLSTGLPTLSALKNEPERFLHYYGKILQLLSITTMPLTAYLIVCSEDVVLILLGDNWLEAAYIFKILGFSSFLLPTFSGAMGLAVLPFGKSRRYFNLGLIRTVVISSSVIAGIQWGIFGVTWAYSIATVICMVLSLPFYLSGSPVCVTYVVRNLKHALLSSVVAGLSLWFLRDHFGEYFKDMYLPVRAVIYFIIHLALFSCFICGTKEGRSSVRDIYEIIAHRFSRKEKK